MHKAHMALGSGKDRVTLKVLLQGDYFKLKRLGVSGAFVTIVCPVSSHDTQPGHYCHPSYGLQKRLYHAFACHSNHEINTVIFLLHRGQN